VPATLQKVIDRKTQEKYSDTIFNCFFCVTFIAYKLSNYSFMLRQIFCVDLSDVVDSIGF
jgi:hypothetical protein